MPYLAGYDGSALFCDCDFLWIADIADLIDWIEDRYAVMCVQHDYWPAETSKMYNHTQTVYPRKNWSSLVLYNCGHPANAVLTPALVNRETDCYLHRFQWLDDDLIGTLPETWNWLEGWTTPAATGLPNAVHFTLDGPWFEDWLDVAYVALWRAERSVAE